ncbi:MAG: hypothetical protein MUO30_10770 [Anaerolineales bacterium]|nr:hypothetical protein [Anaerolineales bacterium]
MQLQVVLWRSRPTDWLREAPPEGAAAAVGLATSRGGHKPPSAVSATRVAEDSFSIIAHFWQIAPARERRSWLPACTQFFRVSRLS